MSKHSGIPKGLLQAVDRTLALLDAHAKSHPSVLSVAEPLPSLLEQCQQLCAQITEQTAEPIRTIHHFACTGGTLICKQLAVMPNTQVLSELDPLSKQHPHPFAPSDLILQLRNGLRDVEDSLLVDVFLAGLAFIYEDAGKYGTRLVLRDHTHSHFCDDQDNVTRLTFLQIIAARFPTCTVVTVRHPLDSYLSLRANGWIRFKPKTLDEYARRYLRFLAAYAQQDIFKYEDFIEDPATVMSQICAALQLPYNPYFLDLASAAHLSGDSGRSGSRVRERKRRPVPGEVAQEQETSAAYRTLCVQLGYVP